MTGRNGTGCADEALASRARAGDRAALSALAARWHAPVLRFCRRRLGNEEDARDVAQEVMLRATRAIGSYDAARPFAPWIWRIARNACLNQYERLRVRAGAPRARPPHAPRSPEDLVADREEVRRVRAALDLLEAGERSLLEMKLLEGLPNAQIAERLGITRGALRTRACRALTRLRAALGEGTR